MPKTKRQAELRAKLKKIEVELKELDKKSKEIKKQLEKFLEKIEDTHTSSKIKSLRESL
jgi:peptidoglycan hydrolase CwlO-like protein